MFFFDTQQHNGIFKRVACFMNVSFQSCTVNCASRSSTICLVRFVRSVSRLCSASVPTRTEVGKHFFRYFFLYDWFGLQVQVFMFVCPLLALSVKMEGKLATTKGMEEQSKCNLFLLLNVDQLSIIMNPSPSR